MRVCCVTKGIPCFVLYTPFIMGVGDNFLEHDVAPLCAAVLCFVSDQFPEPTIIRFHPRNVGGSVNHAAVPFIDDVLTV